MKKCQCGEYEPKPKFQSLTDFNVYNLEQVKQRPEQDYYVIDENGNRKETLSKGDIWDEV